MTTSTPAVLINNQPLTSARLGEIEQLIETREHKTTLGERALPELIAEVRRLQAALREACDWLDCESGEGIAEQRAAVLRLRVLVGGRFGNGE